MSQFVMSQFVIHSIPGSPFGRAVLMALEEKRAPYTLAPVATSSACCRALP